MGILILIRLGDLMINVYSLSTIYTWNIVNIFWNKEPPSPSSMFQEKGCPFSCIDVTFFFFNKYPKIYSVVFWMLQIRQFSHDLHGIVTQYVTILKSCLFIHFIRLCRLTFLYSRMYRVQRMTNVIFSMLQITTKEIIINLIKLIMSVRHSFIH